MMFNWFKGKPKRPSDYELGSRIASTIDAFLQHVGSTELASDRLCVVIGPDYRVAISIRTEGALAAVPLRDLKIEPGATGIGGPLRHMAIDFGARIVLDRLRSNEISN
jgi:hypothetical protein